MLKKRKEKALLIDEVLAKCIELYKPGVTVNNAICLQNEGCTFDMPGSFEIIKITEEYATGDSENDHQLGDIAWAYPGGEYANYTLYRNGRFATIIND